jgi:hypothetical protein
MLELYFLIYRVPKMMTGLARERNRSALGWSLMGVGAWLCAEIFVVFAGSFLYGVGSYAFGWSLPSPPGLRLLLYIVALVAGLGGASLVQRILYSKSADDDRPLPPPPPEF